MGSDTTQAEKGFIDSIKGIQADDVLDWFKKNVVPILGIVGTQVAWEYLDDYIQSRRLEVSSRDIIRTAGRGLTTGVQVGIGVSFFK